jgi:hypothetical protein
MTICSLPPTLANFVGSVLAHSLNTGYTVRAHALTQICSADAPQTSYSPETLDDILLGGLKGGDVNKRIDLEWMKKGISLMDSG